MKFLILLTLFFCNLVYSATASRTYDRQVPVATVSPNSILVSDASGKQVWASMSGQIIATASINCPTNTIKADGSAISRTQYPTLFAALGTSHGSGNGTTTFNLPDYRGRFLRGVDDTAGNDPDKASRTAMNTGGNTGNNVGSVQATSTNNLDSIYSQKFGTDGGFFGPVTLDQTAQNYVGLETGRDSGLKTYTYFRLSGKETRPKNAYVTYCIFI